MIESFAIHTAVLVGLVVTWAWTERAGGVFAGFAVPGYLAAIALVAPSSALAIAVEAVLTYGVAWLLGEGLPYLGLTSRVFGRQRFLLFVLASVPVRLWVEGIAADGYSGMLGPWLGVSQGDGFFGVGLVLVPLLANAFWKLGLLRGMAQTGATTAATVGILWFAVMPLLGLEFSSFLLSFEDIATDFVAAPKVYILLLCTAFVATWTADRFGWNAGGLLVPALLSLLVFEPVKLSTTFLEIVLLTALYRGITELPYIRRIELSGSRRLVAMYMMAWGLKLSLAWVGMQFELPVAAWDLYGFGYLLSSLVAVRCLDLRPIGRVLLPMGINFGVGASVGMLAATGLHLLMPPPPNAGRSLQGLDALTSAPRSVLLAAGTVRQDPEAAVHSRRVARALVRLMSGDDRLPTRMADSQVVRADGAQCTTIRSAGVDGAHAWWCGGEGPILYVDRPISDPDSVWIAARMLDEGTASGLVLAGMDSSRDPGLAAQHFSVMTAVIPSRAMLVLNSTDVGPSTLRAKGTAGRPPVIPGRENPVMVRVGGENMNPLWTALGPKDGVLTISVAEAEEPLFAPDEPVPAHVATPADRNAQPLDPHASWLIELALHRAAQGGEPPAGLAWAASSLNMTLQPTEDGTWWLGSQTGMGFGHWILRPNATSTWIVAAPRASIEHGAAQAAFEMADRLDARATWVAHRAARGLERTPHRLLDGPDVATATMRRALRPSVGGAPGNVLLVRRTSSSVPDAPVSMLAGATEVLESPPSELAEASNAVWPGTVEVDGHFLPPSSLGGHQPLRYLHGLQPGRSWVLWLRPNALAEVSDTPDLIELERWYGLRGVEVVGPERLPAITTQADDVQLLQDIQSQQQAPNQESLLSISRSGQPVLVRDGVRLRLAVVSDDYVCISTNGAPRETPGTGCWRRP